MIRRVVFCVVFIFVILSRLDPFSKVDDTIDAFIHRGIQLTITQQYQEAIATFDSLKLFTKNDPRPYFYHAAAIQARMLDYENYREQQEFFNLITKTIEFSENWISEDSTEALGCFFKGASYSYRGFFHAQRKSYLKGIRDAMLGIKFLEKAVQIDSTIFDAYLGIGSFYYWRSRLTQIFDWLPMFPDQREEGIELIHKAVRLGRYGRDVAINSLIWIEIDRGNLSDAVRLSTQMLKKYPDCRYFLWPLAESYFKAGSYEKAIKQYQKIIASFRQQEINNHYNEVVCGLKISRAFLLQKNYSAAKKAAVTALQFEHVIQHKDRLNEKFDELKDIVKTCDEVLSFLNNHKPK